MFLPRHFAEHDHEVIVGLLRHAGYGHLVVIGDVGLVSTPLPFVVDDAAASVRAHLARPNPVWRLAPCDALLIVPGADTYISPSWYPSRADHGRVVPTWNYEVVHLHGHLVAHDDADWVAAQIRDLTDLHESPMPIPWSVDDAPTDYIERSVGGIVGVELEVSRVDAKRKLSQNKATADVVGAIDGLDSSPHRGAVAIRSAMIESYVDSGGPAESR